jgi:hypothetical protein
VSFLANQRHEGGHPREVVAIRWHSLKQVNFLQPRLKEGPQYAEGASHGHRAAGSHQDQGSKLEQQAGIDRMTDVSVDTVVNERIVDRRLGGSPT